jgi:hypothetical protein
VDVSHVSCHEFVDHQLVRPLAGVVAVPEHILRGVVAQPAGDVAQGPGRQADEAAARVLAVLEAEGLVALDQVGEDGVHVDEEDVDAAVPAGQPAQLHAQLPVEHERQLVTVRCALRPQTAGDPPLRWDATHRRRPGHPDLLRTLRDQRLHSCARTD